MVAAVEPVPGLGSCGSACFSTCATSASSSCRRFLPFFAGWRWSTGRSRACWLTLSMRLTSRPAAPSALVARVSWGPPCPPPASHHLNYRQGLLMVLAVAAACSGVARRVLLGGSLRPGSRQPASRLADSAPLGGGACTATPPKHKALHRQAASSSSWGAGVRSRPIADRVMGIAASSSYEHETCAPQQYPEPEPEPPQPAPVPEQPQQASEPEPAPQSPAPEPKQAQCTIMPEPVPQSPAPVQCNSHMLQSQSQSHYRQRQRLSTLTLQSQSQSRSRQRQRLSKVSQPRCQSQCHGRQARARAC